MEETRAISPEEIFSGSSRYTRDQFRLDILFLNEPNTESQDRIDSLNKLIDKILIDIETNNEPEQFLKQFYQLHYYTFTLDSKECNVALIDWKFQNVSSFTYHVYLIYASLLNERYRNRELTEADFNKIKKKYFDSFNEFREEFETYKSLLKVVAES